MKIGIDARLYGPRWGGGGLGRYVEELVTALQHNDTENRYVLFLKPENAEACKITNPNFEKVVVDAHWYTAKEQLLMPPAITKAKVDLMHFPHWNVPLLNKTPFIVTIHDLILLDEPTSAKATTLGPIRYGLKHFGFRQVLRHAVQKSERIIAVSDFTKQSILRHFEVPKEKIQVIYEGVTMTRRASTDALLPITKPYFLYVGSAYPHKNLESLLHAFSFFVKAYPKTKLVLVGKDDLFYQRLKKEVEEIGIQDSVIFPGFVPDEQLTELYAHASLYLYPSRIEGFGLPPLEAMQHGIPVAAARRGPLPEVLGDAAIYFDPDNIEQMVGVMEEALKDESKMAEMIRRGAEQVKKYSWETMARETRALYERAKT